jgi:2-haloacid dehalogenase
LDEIAAACLVMIAANHGTDLELDEAKKAIKPLESLSAHPDTEPALKRLKEAGFTLATLTNSPQMIMEKQLGNAGLSKFFTKQLSVSGIETFKPHVATYQWAGKQMGKTPADCMLVAAHAWDIAGAMRAGMRGAFVSRPGAQPYPLASSGEFTSPDLTEVADYIIDLWEGELVSGFKTNS